jgi:hypothetical protein
MNFNPRYAEPKRGLYSLSKEPFDAAAARQQANADNLDFWLIYGNELFPNGLRAKERK